jgi:hypothetical protein
VHLAVRLVHARWLHPAHLSWAAWVHVGAAVVACLLLPALSRAAGGGGLAWTMFSKSDSFRLTLVATDQDGGLHQLHPVELALFAEPALRFYLLGADRFHTWPVGPMLRTRLPALAAIACTRLVQRAYASIELTLEERADLDAPIRATRVRASCHRR